MGAIGVVSHLESKVDTIRVRYDILRNHTRNHIHDPILSSMQPTLKALTFPPNSSLLAYSTGATVNEDSDGRLSGSAGMRIRACVVLEIEETSLVQRRDASSDSRNRR